MGVSTVLIGELAPLYLSSILILGFESSYPPRDALKHVIRVWVSSRLAKIDRV